MDRKMVVPLRRQMKAFIDADHREISLKRPQLEKTDTGGFTKGNWLVLPAQRFRLVPYKRRLTDIVTSRANGELPYLLYVLIGMYDADIKRMDEFELDGAYYRVQGLEPHTAVEEFTDRKVAQLSVLDESGVEWLAPAP